jgi:hypothetical protein
MNIVPESEAKSILITLSPFSLSPTTSLETSYTAVDPEPKSISEHALPSVFPLTSLVLLIPSIPALCMNAVTEPELEFPLYSTPSCHIDVPEPKCMLSTLLISLFPMPFDDAPKFTFTPPSSSSLHNWQ